MSDGTIRSSFQAISCLAPSVVLDMARNSDFSLAGLCGVPHREAIAQVFKSTQGTDVIHENTSDTLEHPRFFFAVQHSLELRWLVSRTGLA